MANISMYVHAITLDTESNSPILILKEENGERTLPIWIGLLEATAIATEMEKIEFARPMTHDLSVNLLKTMEIKIPRIEISDLRDNTYYALITLKQGDREITVDARPSDAVAIALRAEARIFVNESVLKKTQPAKETIISGERTPEEKDKWAKILEEMDPNAFKYKI
ncbi:MAG: bifunctional nuclease family protein [Deltaproteobacteria bacterium]|nr:bifunctional nuclease family protein [Deltaproteobacteria bacterium]RKX57967.1 MAG: bifunctional nuclease family protein [Thermodesulfobacteriota bacterium]MBW1967724.1 bifunctional nuclease family protein [Deltaproteobacteria bacterium]MBW2098064.1 bifunctional nuclease family protein [Deltaproteobacteria bacterium]RLB88312.1 MAG: bifunctional nuclease family protein [Deltaproteobacteria bacterium]